MPTAKIQLFPFYIRVFFHFQPCSPTSVLAGDGEDNDCDGMIDEETDNGIDDDGDGQIDEDLAIAPRGELNTVVDTEYITFIRCSS